MRVHLQVVPTRLRPPDVTVCSDRPRGRYVVEAPQLCVHVLAGRKSRIETRIDEYLEMGVPYVWLLDPEAKRGWEYTREGWIEAPDGIMRTANPELAMPLSEAFAD
ncbi:MAG: Uma2 family endonuclease [Bryobacteraceae bacterium]|nr:Uma2 family endonuclease [Bryobacteraceae bacterium]